ncbi:MAG: hypothetical protein LBT09_08070 [Planctomycetaceae bacterium]|nr:hypothetical protein [Planctomycetaceae bacterium]
MGVCVGVGLFVVWVVAIDIRVGVYKMLAFSGGGWQFVLRSVNGTNRSIFENKLKNYKKL